MRRTLGKAPRTPAWGERRSRGDETTDAKIGGTQVPEDCKSRGARQDAASDDDNPTPPASRARRHHTLAFLALTLSGLAGLGLWLSSPGATPTQGPLPDLEAARPTFHLGSLQPSTVATIEAEAVPLPIGRTLTIEKGQTLLKVLDDVGISKAEALQAVSALQDVYSPRKIKAGQAIRIALASDGNTATLPGGEATEGSRDGGALKLLSLAFQPSLEQDIRVVRGDGTTEFVATAIERPLTREIVGGAGVIDSSLFTAGQRAGVPTPVIIELIRAFSYEVDFQREVREADDFELLYESHYDEHGKLAKTGAVIFAGLTLSGRLLELYRFTPKSGRPDYFDPSGLSVRRALLRTPVDGARMSSGFGMRKHPILGYSKMHRGIDFAAPAGTPVFAAGDGTVVEAGRKGAYGNYLRIRHSGGYQTAYAHMNRTAAGIAAGKHVGQGQVIGYVGSTGRATGPHLHYEVLANNQQIDPAGLMLPSGEKLAGEDLKAFKAAKARIDRLRDQRPTALQLVEAVCGAAPAIASLETADGEAARRRGC